MHRKRKLLFLICSLTLLFTAACASGETGQQVLQENIEEGQMERGKTLTTVPTVTNAVISVTPLPTPLVTQMPMPSLTPTPTPVPSMSIVMVGDVLLHTRILEGALLTDGSYDFTSLFLNVTEKIRTADLAIANQEVILGGSGLGVSGYPAFNAPYEVGDALARAGFDLICHATNHALDKGKTGVLNCIGFWRKNYPDIGVIGIYDSEEAQNTIYYYEENGITVAVLNYTYGTNGIALPSDMPYAVNLLKKEKVIADLKQAEETADFVIVCPHWGTEYKLEPTKEQEEWADIFEEYGADLVLGTHPHVIEPIEWQDDMLIYYSIGNFVNWTSGTKPGTANRMVGGMAEITLERAEDGTVLIADYGVTPLICHVEKGSQKVTVYTIFDYTKELAERNAIRNQDEAFSYEYCVELCDSIWGELWRKND